MRRKLISLLLAGLTVLGLAAAPTGGARAEGLSAAEAAEALHSLGLMDGVGTNKDGSINYNLTGTANRQTATTMLVRVLGKESAATAGSWRMPFSDFDNWAKPYVGYAYTNGLVTGVAAASFGGWGTVTAQQYITMMLRALGYVDDGSAGADFTYATACEFAKGIGLNTAGYTNSTRSFTRGDIAILSFAALGLEQKGTGKSLYAASTGGKDADLEKAAEAGRAAAAGQSQGQGTAPVVYANSAPGTKASSNSAKTVTVDYSHTADGYVMVSAKLSGSPKLVVIVTAPSGTEYKYFSTDSSGGYQAFPLTEGGGSYKVAVYRNLSGNQYTTLHSVSIQVTMADANAPFLRPNIYVDYTASTKAVVAAQTICKDCETELDKVAAVYYYVVDAFSYDYDKAKTVESGYRPILDTVWNAKKGICFDYASVMAAMLRSQGVPTKLVVGYAGTAYHAWVNVYTKESGWIEAIIYFDGATWKLMDPTFASTGKNNASVLKFINDPSNYTAKYTY